MQTLWQKRGSILGLRPITTKKKVPVALMKRHLEKLKGYNSDSLEVLKGNPYYRDCLVHFLNPAMVGINFY